MKHGSRVAFDCTYSDRVIGKLARAGYQVLCVAKDGETDESWFKRAVDSGVEIIFSRDNDLVKLMAKLKVKNITIINDQKGIVIKSEEMDMLKD